MLAAVFIEGSLAHARFDLEERLPQFAVRVGHFAHQLPSTRAGSHVAAQLLRSGMSPYPNHGEAQAAKSRRDFVHKLRVCLKELRETGRWLRLVEHVPLIEDPDSAIALRQETEELHPEIRSRHPHGGTQPRG